MYTKKLFTVVFGVIACNSIVVALLFALPAKNTRDIQTLESEVPVGVATTTPDVVTKEIVSDPEVQNVHFERTSIAPAPAGEALQVPAQVSTSAHATTSVRIPIQESGILLELMRTYDSMSDTFSFEGKEHPGIGFFVQEINGVREGEGFFWMVYLNGKTADLGASRLHVVPSDVVEWRFEEGYSTR